MKLMNKILFVLILLGVSGFASDKLLIRVASHVLKKNEGVRYEPYRDVYGYLTIGIGHKIKPNENFGRLSKKEVYDLFAKDIKKHINLCRKYFSKFDTYPICVQVAILDGFFRGDLSGSPKTMRLINQGKWIEASREYLNHTEYKQSKIEKTGVYKRMDRNALMYLRYGEKLRGE
jgi:GH24 family phage-related lysozyme (muramidase)